MLSHIFTAPDFPYKTSQEWNGTQETENQGLDRTFLKTRYRSVIDFVLNSPAFSRTL
jgi:hypothetical protein